MGVYIKNGSGDIKKLAGYVTVRQNARWFLCTRTIEDNVEYYTVPKEAETYFKSINAYTIYSLGFNESNTTNTPKLRYGTTVLDIKDFSNQAGEVMVGQLNGVFQMFTQDLATDPKIYFVANTHKDEYDTEMSNTSTNAVQNKVIKAYADNIGTLAEAIKNNTVQIINANGGLQLGNSNTESDGIAIGQNARAKNAASLALGYGSDANISNASGVYTAIGYNAKTSGANSIQLGTGTNYQGNTLQIYKDNIYNHSTHTATFQNLQIDGVDEYPTLSGADAPTTTTVGKVKQFYVETTTPALYYCSSITGTGTTEDPYVYNWTQVGGAGSGGGKQLYQHTIGFQFTFLDTGYLRCFLTIINENNEVINTETKLKNAVIEKIGSSMTYATEGLSCSGYSIYTNPEQIIPYRIYVENNALTIGYQQLCQENVDVTIDETTYKLQIGNTLRSSTNSLLNFSITDTVVAL